MTDKETPIDNIEHPDLDTMKKITENAFNKFMEYSELEIIGSEELKKGVQKAMRHFFVAGWVHGYAYCYVNASTQESLNEQINELINGDK